MICINCGKPVHPASTEAPDFAHPDLVGLPKHDPNEAGFTFWCCLDGRTGMAELWPAPTGEPVAVS